MAVGAALVALIGACASPSENGIDPAKAARIERFFHLRSPYRVAASVGYRDGGSGTYTIKGAFGGRRDFWWDGAARAPRLTDEQLRDLRAGFPPVDTIPRLLYEGGHSERRLSLGSDEELAAIELLELAGRAGVGAIKLDSLYEALAARPTLDHLREVQSLFDEKGRWAFGAFDLAQGLRRQRRLGWWRPLNWPPEWTRPDSGP